VLERHAYLELNDEVRHQLISISEAPIDRISKPWRCRSGRGTTKPGSLLKHQVPVRTFADWEENKPGFFEADLVAHYGWSIEGSILYTLTLTDIATTWTECLPLLYRGQDAVIHAIDLVRPLIPFPILGMDTDNGTEFLKCRAYRLLRKGEDHLHTGPALQEKRSVLCGTEKRCCCEAVRRL